jgi:hypothetical protein
MREEFVPVADLREYVLFEMPGTTCPDCKRHVYGLAPRLDADATLPFYFLCLCGRNAQAGCARAIAPREVD